MSYRAKCDRRRQLNLRRCRKEFAQAVLAWLESQKLPVREPEEPATITVKARFIGDSLFFNGTSCC